MSWAQRTAPFNVTGGTFRQHSKLIMQCVSGTVGSQLRTCIVSVHAQILA